MDGNGYRFFHQWIDKFFCWYLARKMKAHKSKTIWFSLALVIFGALFDNFSVLQGLIDPKFYSYSLILIGVIVAILRFLTSKPIE